MTTNPATIVKTKYGKIEGTYEKDLFVFKGIPFAAPPVGKLRWMPPEPPASWSDIRQAKTYGTIAPQNLMFPDLFGEEDPEPQSEDCLFLNIWTPGLVNSRRPVMVWIHGGAFSIGSGSSVMYRDSTLPSRGNIVLVTINYRLGLLGFLNLNELSSGKIPSTGNEGLLDQVAALEWVRDNIEAFGGDPSNVTVFGESAGGMSISCLMTMPKAQGLFHKAVIESPVGEIARPLKQSLKVTEVFLQIAGIGINDEAALRALPVERLLSIQTELAEKTGQGLAPAIPAADGKILPMMPLDSFKAGKASKVPTLAGTNLEEQKLFAVMEMGPAYGRMDEAGLLNSIKRFVNDKDAATLIEGYRKNRVKRGELVTPIELSCAIITDIMFRFTALQIAEAQCKFGNPGYNYLFTWKSPLMNGLLGSCHALEMAFIFGNPDPVFTGTGPDADKLSSRMQDAWLSFAVSGNPSCDSLGNWPQYSGQKHTMILGKDSRLEKEAYEEDRRLWDSITMIEMGNMP